MEKDASNLKHSRKHLYVRQLSTLSKLSIIQINNSLHRSTKIRVVEYCRNPRVWY